MSLYMLIRRNVKLFFKDKSLFISALIAPLILLFLFIAFLGNTYKDSLKSGLMGFPVSDRLIEGFAAGWLISSLIAVCAVSIAFTANLTMVQDKIMGRSNDLAVAPVSNSTLALGYYLATALVTGLICYIALFAGFIYIAIAGWELSVSDVFLTILDTFLLVLFGTAISSVVCRFLKSQGGITAVEVIVSAAYGFMCGAYMPISQLASVLQTVLKFLPGTYGTSLLHEHLMGGAIDAIGTEGASSELLDGVRDGFDCNLYFFDKAVPQWAMYLVLSVTVIVLVAVYVGICILLERKRKSK